MQKSVLVITDTLIACFFLSFGAGLLLCGEFSAAVTSLGLGFFVGSLAATQHKLEQTQEACDEFEQLLDESEEEVARLRAQTRDADAKGAA